MCDLFPLSLNRSFHITCIAFAHNVPFVPFGLGKLYPSRVSYAHDVTTDAPGVTMQMCARLHNQKTDLVVLCTQRHSTIDLSEEVGFIYLFPQTSNGVVLLWCLLL